MNWRFWRRQRTYLNACASLGMVEHRKLVYFYNRFTGRFIKADLYARFPGGFALLDSTREPGAIEIWFDTYKYAEQT